MKLISTALRYGTSRRWDHTASPATHAVNPQVK